MPVIAPGFYDNRILFAPLFFKFIQVLFAQFLTYRPIDFFDVCDHCFGILTGNVFYSVANLMDDATLHLRFREYTGFNEVIHDKLKKSFQAQKALDGKLFDYMLDLAQN